MSAFVFMILCTGPCSSAIPRGSLALAALPPSSRNGQLTRSGALSISGARLSFRLMLKWHSGAILGDTPANRICAKPRGRPGLHPREQARAELIWYLTCCPLLGHGAQIGRAVLKRAPFAPRTMES